MKVLEVADTAIDLLAQDIVFHPGATVLMVNVSGSAESLTSSDASGSGYAELLASPDKSVKSVTLDKQYIKLASAGLVQLIAN